MKDGVPITAFVCVSVLSPAAKEIFRCTSHGGGAITVGVHPNNHSRALSCVGAFPLTHPVSVAACMDSTAIRSGGLMEGTSVLAGTFAPGGFAFTPPIHHLTFCASRFKHTFPSPRTINPTT
jgi:hypothetical protein